ncbi:MAG: HEAT repeat domain-containing protein [Gemmatimonadetes bacterium]|nr:HEAT repeat domain-containing protein [Gemmatimonadota bacterium]
MSTSVLATIALAQAAFLGLLLFMLLTRRLVAGVSAERSKQHGALANRTVRRWLAGEVDEEHLRLQLGQLSFAHLSCFLQKLSMQMGGADWERVSTAVRRMSWYEKVRSHTGSRLWWRRLQAARALMVVAEQEDQELIAVLLRDDRAAVRRAAVWSLKRVGSPELAAAALDLAAGEPRVLRAQILEILAGSRAHVLGSLIERLHGGRERDELRTALSLAEMLGVPGLLEHILPHAEDFDFEIRVATARSLASYPHARSSAALIRMLEDPTWQVRAQAAAGLGAIGAREAVEQLDRALTDLSWWVRLRCALALRRIGTDGVVLLQRRRPEDDAYAYEMAQYVLHLDKAAIAEYSGAYVVDYSEAPSSEHAA